MEKDKLFAEALGLPNRVRAELAERLLRSLEDDEEDISAEEWTAAWTDEIKRRLEGIRQGTAELIDGDEGLRRARDVLQSERK